MAKDDDDGWSVNPLPKKDDGWQVSPRAVARDYRPIVERYAKEFNVDPLLIMAMIQQESGGNPYAVGPDTHAQPGQRAQGLMQLMPGTAKDMGVTDPFDMEQNIRGGTRYLRQLLDHPSSKGDIPTALLHYVGGRDPKNWGAQSFAYPSVVLQHYRKLGGRTMDPSLPKYGAAERLANAALPFNATSHITKGRLPDLSQGLSGPEANRPVGAKLRDWWNSISPEREAHEKALANYADENPLMALGMDVVGSLPSQVGIGAAVNGLLRGATAGGMMGRLGTALAGPYATPHRAVPYAARATAPWQAFIAGQGGYGLPGTGEGASLLGKIGSGAANGVLQGAISGATTGFLTPETSTLDDTLQGAGVGGVFGSVLPAASAIGKRIVFGAPVDREVTKQGARAVNLSGHATNLPKVPLQGDPNQANNLSLDPAQFSRAVAGMIDEPVPLAIEQGQLREGQRRIWKQIDESSKQLYGRVDSKVWEGLDAIAQEFRGDPTFRQEVSRMADFKNLTARLKTAALTDGIFTGEDYQKWLTKGGVLDRMGQSTNPGVREAGKRMRTLVDEAFDEGVREQMTFLQMQGRFDEAAKVGAAYATFGKAREQYKMLKAIEPAIDPLTKKIIPSKLLASAEGVGGNLEEMGWIGKNFDPANTKETSRLNIPYTAMATAGTIANPAHAVTTGTAALAATLLGGAGKLGQHAVRKIPGYSNALLRRSLREGPGPLEEALRTLGLPAGVQAMRAAPPLPE